MLREAGSVKWYWSLSREPGCGGWGGFPPGRRWLCLAFSSRSRRLASYSACSASSRSSARASKTALARARFSSRRCRRVISPRRPAKQLRFGSRFPPDSIPRGLPPATGSRCRVAGCRSPLGAGRHRPGFCSRPGGCGPPRLPEPTTALAQPTRPCRPERSGESSLSGSSPPATNC